MLTRAVSGVGRNFHVDTVLRAIRVAAGVRIANGVPSPQKLAELLSATGHDAEDVIAAAESETVQAIYAGRAAEAIAAGVIGSPCYVLNGEVFWGQDRLDLVARALESKRAPFKVDAVD